MPATAGGNDWNTSLPALDLVGMHVQTESALDATPTGLFIGAADERAWIIDVSSERSFESVHVDLGWTDSQIDLLDLEVFHEQWLNGEAVASDCTPLADVPGTRALTNSPVRLTMPSLGRGVGVTVSSGPTVTA